MVETEGTTTEWPPFNRLSSQSLYLSDSAALSSCLTTPIVRLLGDQPTKAVIAALDGERTAMRSNSAAARMRVANLT